jgi:polyhydroxybutyrate depolymerase
MLVRVLAPLGAALLLMFGSGMAMAAPAACTLAAPGVTTRVPVAGTGRSLLLHLPGRFDPATPAPLVLLLHGSGGSGAAILAESRLADTADRAGFIVAAPDAGVPAGKGFAWNIPGVPTINGTIPGPDAPDDTAYLTAAIRWLAASGCADPARVYVTGLSGGGRMASWLGCVAADRIAAIAPVVGLRAGNPSREDKQRPDPDTCRPSHPMPILAFAGDADTTNPIDGAGAGYWQYSMHVAEQRWAVLDHCTEAPATHWVEPGIYEEGYTDCAGGSAVLGRITVGGTHHWLADNDAMWAFLSRFRRQP